MSISIFIVPISMFVKKYITGLPYYLSQIQLYCYILLMLASLIMGKKIYVNRLINKRVIIGAFSLILFQIIAMMWSNYTIGISDLNKSPIKQIAKLVIFLILLYGFYITLSFVIQTKKDIRFFLKGIFYSLIGISILCYIQLLSLIGNSGTINRIIEFIATLFEQRTDREWYLKGSYVQTLHRINALYQESGFLAAILLILFGPFLIASIKNKVNLFDINKKYNKSFYYLLLLNLIVLLFCIQSTTGILGIVVILIILFKDFPLKSKLWLIVSLIIASLIFIYLYNQHGFLYETINNLIFNKGESSTNNRLGGTIGLMITWAHHSFFGVGWEYHDYFTFQNAPEWSKRNWEYNNIFVNERFYPILSIFFGLLAEFGTIIMLIIIIYIYRFLRELKSLGEISKEYFSYKKYKIILTINDAAKYFILLYIGLSFLSFDWKQPHYIVIFFFFVIYRQLLKRKLEEISNEHS